MSLSHKKLLQEYFQLIERNLSQMGMLKCTSLFYLLFRLDLIRDDTQPIRGRLAELTGS